RRRAPRPGDPDRPPAPPALMGPGRAERPRGAAPPLPPRWWLLGTNARSSRRDGASYPTLALSRYGEGLPGRGLARVIRRWRLSRLADTPGRSAKHKLGKARGLTRSPRLPAKALCPVMGPYSTSDLPTQRAAAAF